MSSDKTVSSEKVVSFLAAWDEGSNTGWYCDRWYSARPKTPPGTRDPGVRVEQLPEAFVHDIWRNCDFAATAMVTVTGERVVVRDPGRLNPNGGPDFLNARVRIGDVEWIGDVELHLASEDWFRHGHQRDPRYNSVVLHVTLVADLWTGSVSREDGSFAPEIVLSRHLNSKLRTLLVRFRTRDDVPIVCANEWRQIPLSLRTRTVYRMTRMRLLRRANNVRTELRRGLSTSEVLYRRTFACLGYSKNEAPMRSLAERIPLAVARSLCESNDLEALYLGIAGLIPPMNEVKASRLSTAFVAELANRFLGLRKTLNIPTMIPTQWQYFRLRPSNFPSIRIAQGCALIRDGLLSCSADSVWTRWNDETNADVVVEELLRKLDPFVNEFWKSHYRLERTSRPHSASIGLDRRRRIILNAVLPTVLAAAVETRRKATLRTCVRILELLPPENDDVTRTFMAIGADLSSSRDSQGVHELYSKRCTDHGCLRCDIGRHILRSSTRR